MSVSNYMWKMPVFFYIGCYWSSAFCNRFRMKNSYRQWRNLCSFFSQSVKESSVCNFHNGWFCVSWFYNWPQSSKLTLDIPNLLTEVIFFTSISGGYSTCTKYREQRKKKRREISWIRNMYDLTLRRKIWLKFLNSLITIYSNNNNKLWSPSGEGENKTKYIFFWRSLKIQRL